MHQTKKGNQWHAGLKEGTLHSAVTPAANVTDCRVLPGPLHGEERKVWGDSG